MSTADVPGGTANEVLAGTALTAENRSVEVDGATLVYRAPGAGAPLPLRVGPRVHVSERPPENAITIM